MPRTSSTSAPDPAPPATVDAYIAGFPPHVQAILQQVRQLVRTAAPDAQECLSYRMPAYKLHGVLVYFAAFKTHLGVYPPIRGDAALTQALAPYANDKGNLRFPYAQPIPYDLLTRLVLHRRQQLLAQAAAKKTKRATA